MTDILLHKGKYSLIGTGAHKSDYLYMFDPHRPANRLAESERRPKHKERLSKYGIKIVSDPLDVGGFASGTRLSKFDYDCMLSSSGFTLGTVLIKKGILYIVYDDNGRQRVKNHSISTSPQNRAQPPKTSPQAI